MNALGRFLLAPLIAALPGWLSNAIVAAVTGVILLFVFKYTSNQAAIGRVRNRIKANMLALKLFKDSMTVTLQSQGRVFHGALRLLVHAVGPMLVMIVPVSLLLAQLGLWYQARPLRRGETAEVTMKLSGAADASWPEVSLEPMAAVRVKIGPVRILSKREICWEIEAREDGNHSLVFDVDRNSVEKQVAVGRGFMPVSVRRPGWNWASVLRHPWEKPFSPKASVRSIAIDYPDRSTWTSGTNSWVIFFFIASMLLALVFKPLVKVRM